MLRELRRVIWEKGQEAFASLVREYLVTGKWDTYLAARYHICERMLDMVEAEIRREENIELPSIPVAAMSETEFRALWGDR